jgi:ribosomal protein S18 acetylase RimI-like enzyme
VTVSADGRPRPDLRPAREADADAVAELLRESARGVYDRYAGSQAGAMRVLRAAGRRAGTTASLDVVTVAELDGRVAGLVAAFPVGEAERRAERFLAVSLAYLPPWRWPRALGLFRAGSAAAPPPPPGALYIDALATAEGARGRGVGRALLDAVRDEARRMGLSLVALETEADNTVARRLYEGAGFQAGEQVPARGGLPAFVPYISRLG